MAIDYIAVSGPHKESHTTARKQYAAEGVRASGSAVLVAWLLY